MYRWEIAWYQPMEVFSKAGMVTKEVYCYKGFTKKEAYEKKLNQLYKKGYKVVGLIEDGRVVLKVKGA